MNQSLTPPTQSPNPFAAEGHKLSPITHNSCCVAVKFFSDGSVKVRNANNPGSPVLELNKDEWAAFIHGVKLGVFDGYQ